MKVLFEHFSAIALSSVVVVTLFSSCNNGNNGNDDYYSIDLRAFDLKGKVISVTYPDDLANNSLIGQECFANLRFTEQEGFMLSQFGYYDITSPLRDEQGRITATEDSPEPVGFKYDSNSVIDSLIVYGMAGHEYCFVRNSEGVNTHLIFRHWGSYGGSSDVVTYEDVKYDKCGNWVFRRAHHDYHETSREIDWNSGRETEQTKDSVAWVTETRVIEYAD